MKYTFFLFASVFLFHISLFSVDVVYTITANSDSGLLNLDSILIENLSNESRLIFIDVPDTKHYNLNLNAQAIESGTGINDIQSIKCFSVKENIPGLFRLHLLRGLSSYSIFSVFTLEGKLVYRTKVMGETQGALCTFRIPGNQLYILHVSTKNETKSFKIKGSISNSKFSVYYEPMGVNLKSKEFNSNNDFSFSMGDSLSVTVYKYGYSIEQIKLKVLGSTNLKFFLYVTHGEVADRQGNMYKTVRIGDQWWMAENLRSTKYPDNTDMSLVNNAAAWAKLSDNNSDKAYCWFNDDASTNKTFGALYTFSAASGGDFFIDSNVTGICPYGWHLPSKKEWEVLMEELGGIKMAGGKLKEAGTIHWALPNTGASNSTGFTGVPSGSRANSDGLFYGSLSTYAAYWSSSQFNSTLSWAFFLSSQDASLNFSAINKSNGYAVRCLKDE